MRNSTEIAEFIVDLRNAVMIVLVWFLVVLFAIAIFIILNTVRLSVHSRKSEIIIMRYIGATNFFILFPFLLEGVIIGVVSAVGAYFLQWYIYGLALGTLEQMQTGLRLIDFSEAGAVVLIIFILIGVLCGLLGSSISSQRHLKA
jgi:cell division transport system permease protein